MFIPRKVYGVIGDPIGQSLSPVLHNTGFQAWGIPSMLAAWHITPEKLPDFVAAMRVLPIAGACVTIPHKEKIIPLLDKITPLATRVGAVNTLYWEGNELVGHNTDVEGFLSPLFPRPAFPSALVLGAGGAARAALAGLLELPGVERVQLCARREEQAHALAADVKAPEPEHHDEGGIRHAHAGPEGPAVEVLPWDNREKADADLIINTTPMGMRTQSGMEASASPLTKFPKPRPNGLAYDLICQETPFLEAAKAAGWNTLNGRDMFAVQGTAQFILWTGFPLPDAAFTALDDAIASAHGRG